jgi:hypothetical protein
MTERAITTAAGWMTTRLRVPALSMVILQLLALLVVIRQYQLVSPAFLRIAAVAFIGFVIHHLLPLRYRIPFFVLLSFAGIAIVFGPAALWLIAIGLVLVGICYLPIAFQARIGLLLAAGALLAATRADWLPAPWPVVIWPILGSMFMFRLIVYLYDTQEKATRSPYSVRLLISSCCQTSASPCSLSSITPRFAATTLMRTAMSFINAALCSWFAASRI